MSQHDRSIPELLQAVADSISAGRPTDLDRLLQNVLEIAYKRLSYQMAPDRASILLHEPLQDQLITRAAIGEHAEGRLLLALRPEDGLGIPLEVLRTGEALLVPDVRSPAWRDRFVDAGRQIRCEMDIPLKLGDRVLGVMSFESQRPQAFDEADLHLMSIFAAQVVLAVKAVQAYEQERYLREDEETLIELAKELTQRLEVEDLLDLILRRAIENTRAEAGVLVLVDPRQGDLIVKAEHGVRGAELGRRLSREKGILGLVAREGWMINADLTDPEWRRIHIPVAPNMKSEIAVPLVKDKRVVGVLNVESQKQRFFGQRNERLLTGLADLAVISLQNAERFEISQRRLERFEVLYRASRELAQITAQEQLDRAYVVIVDLATELWACEVVIRRLESGGLRVVKSTGIRKPGPFDVVFLDDPLAGKVVTERRTIYVADASKPPPGIGEFPRSDHRDRAFVVTPLCVESDYYGNLAMSHPESIISA